MTWEACRLMNGWTDYSMQSDRGTNTIVRILFTDNNLHKYIITLSSPSYSNLSYIWWVFSDSFLPPVPIRKDSCLFLVSLYMREVRPRIPMESQHESSEHLRIFVLYWISWNYLPKGEWNLRHLTSLFHLWLLNLLLLLLLIEHLIEAGGEWGLHAMPADRVRWS